MDKYIRRQAAPETNNIRWGRFSTVGRSGCGAVAAYNIAVALGKDPDFLRLVQEMDEKHMPSFGGVFGMNVFRLKFWLQKRFGRADLYLLGAGDWEEKTRFCRAVVILYKNKGVFKGNHFITGVRTGDRFVFYNTGLLPPERTFGMHEAVAVLKKAGCIPLFLIVL